MGNKSVGRGCDLLLIMSIFLTLGANCLVAQVNRASIVGTVTDPSGGVVPRAHVVLLQNATGTTQTTTTDPSGYYAFPSLNYGAYTLTVTHTGFMTYKRTNIQLVQGASPRLNVTLAVGSTTQQVTVSAAASMLETRNTATNYVEDTKTLMQLPLEVNGAKRDPTQWEVTMPGYQGGAGFNTVFNGSVGLYGEQLVDGAPSECNPAALGGCLRASFSAEIVSEMKVSTNVNAESGFTAGEVTSIVTKSGTNQIHGSAYEYMRNNGFDARNFFSPTVPIDKQNEFGFTIGGPVYIPHVYNGKNKTFFFFNQGFFRYLFSAPGSLYTMPVAAYRNGDFSSLLGVPVGTDALGRPVLAGAIYDPTTQRTVNGQIVRDPFPGNIIPTAEFSPVSAKLQTFLPQPQINQVANNYIAAGGSGAQPENTTSIQIDQNIGTKMHLMGIFWRDKQSVSTPFPLPDIFAVRNASFTVGHNPRIDWTWSLSPTTVNEANLALVREYDVLYSNKAAANQGAALIGQPNATGYCLPAVHIGQFFAGTQTELKCGQAEGDTNWSFLDNLSHMQGKHLLKFGFDWTHWAGNFPVTNNGQFTFLPAETGLPGFLSSTGFNYASFLLGQVDDSAVQGGNYEDGRSYTFGFYGQDEWHTTSKLTLTLGLRWDAQPFPEMGKNEVSQFDPTLPNPGAGNRPGALTFAGFGPNTCNCRRVAPSWWFDRNFAPRIGFAYQLQPKTVLRGGYGVYYGPVTQQMAGFDAILQQGYFPLFTAASPDGFTPAFDWTGGFPVPPGGFVRDLSPTVANGSDTYYFGKDAGRPPFIESVNFAVEHQLPGQVYLTARYLGNFAHGILSTAQENINQLNFSNPTIQSLEPIMGANIYSPQAVAAGVPVPYPGFQGTVAQALRPYPQYLTVMNEGSAINWSTYNAFQLQAQKRFSNGLSFLVGYTMSKELADASLFSPGFFASAPQNYYDHRAEKSLANYDVPQQLIFNYVYQLPFGPGKRFLHENNVLDRDILGGWSIAGVQTYQSGTPVAVITESLLPTMGGSDQGPALLRPNIVPGQAIRTNASCSSFDPATQTLMNINAFALPGPFQFGDAPRTLPNVRTCPYFNENISLNKTFPLLSHERATMQIGVDTFNLFNRVQWGGPSGDVSSPSTFGTIGSAGAGRIVQLHARIDW